MKKNFVLAMAVAAGLAMGSIPVSASTPVVQEKVVVAHRGASGYLPEHTLEGYAAAYFMGADYIEQDVVMTRDDHLVVMHDPYLDRVTDVMVKFPKRYHVMPDGSKRWRAVDFTLAEIKTLQVVTSFTSPTGTKPENALKAAKTDWPQRFPMGKSDFEIPTLGEAIELVQGLNKATGRNVGIYPEIKNPSLFRMEGKDISIAVLKELKKYGYTSKSDKVFVQCFNPAETKRISKELMPELGMDLKVVQLIAANSWGESFEIKDGKLVPYDFDWMFQPGGMAKVAEYADGIGPSKAFLIDSKKSTRDHLVLTPMISEAHKAGMVVHPFTFRVEADRILPPAKDFDDMVSMFVNEVGVDGLFSDFPDRAVKVVHSAK
ncbi:glycerophosphodiester phosphodiesterase [Sansalvadorimonas verongulae]|uniref:glycerophosphodiester phosphodiesterase n=1 Tax=Sansalvadorimonas verongulae TaxID=2172824 RepID=UPI0012BB94BE|nr:glycerophosphodiester phosphodiesterase [Sansalvadorimonas verongulae]MTI11978.1 glycerophosphodiester phosphodiesterase [Sansalvadorimonas verongulae]